MRRVTILTIALAGVALLTAACGSTTAPGTTRPGATSPASSPTTIRTGTGNPSDPHLAASAQAHRLLAGLRLPAGSRRSTLPPRAVSTMSLIGTGFSQTVTIARVYRLAVPMNAAYSWLRGQRPAGAVLSAYGSGGIRGRVTMDQVNFRVNTPPSWLYSVSLYTAVRAAGTGSLLLAEAQVQWYPARSPADYIDPARYVSVTVSRLVNNHATSRTFGADSVRRLAAMVNALHAMPDIAIGCPAMGPSIPAYQLRFNPAGTAPAVVVDPTRCFAVDVTVGGHRVQPLFPASPLMTVAQRILRTTARG